MIKFIKVAFIIVGLYSCLTACQTNSNHQENQRDTIRIDSTSADKLSVIDRNVAKPSEIPPTKDTTPVRDTLEQGCKDLDDDRTKVDYPEALETKDINNIDTVIQFKTYQVNLKPITSEEFSKNFRYSNPVEQQYHQICDTSRANGETYFSYAEYIAKKQLKKFGHKIKVTWETKPNGGGRRVNEYIYSFGSRQQYKLQDWACWSNGFRHYFRDIIQLTNDQLYVFMYIDSEYVAHVALLDSDRSNQGIILGGQPQVSPNKKQIFTTSFDYRPNSLTLYEHRVGKLTRVWSLNPQDMDVNFRRSYWLNDQTIL